MNREGLHARIRQARSRAAVLKWESRQAELAGGVWYRLRRLLAYSSAVLAVDDATMDELVSSGFAVSPVGEQIEPRKRIVLLRPADRHRLRAARPLPVGLGPEVLAERNLVLVLWDGLSGP